MAQLDFIQTFTLYIEVLQVTPARPHLDFGFKLYIQFNC